MSAGMSNQYRTLIAFSSSKRILHSPVHALDGHFGAVLVGKIDKAKTKAFLRMLVAHELAAEASAKNPKRRGRATITKKKKKDRV